MPKTKVWVHYLTGDDGEPLTECPACGANLTAPEALEIHCRMRRPGQEFTFLTGAEAETGKIIDDFDTCIADGQHVETVCAACDESLADFDEGTQEDLETEDE
jgi:hypothetical protein